MSAARVVGGRPDRRERRRQNARNPARCQRRMVAGWMSRVASRQAGATRAARTIVKRCQGVHRTRPASFRLATMSCCRKRVLGDQFNATANEIRGQSENESKKVDHGSSLTPPARMTFVARTGEVPAAQAGGDPIERLAARVGTQAPGIARISMTQPPALIAMTMTALRDDREGHRPRPSRRRRRGSNVPRPRASSRSRRPGDAICHPGRPQPGGKYLRVPLSI